MAVGYESNLIFPVIRVRSSRFPTLPPLCAYASSLANGCLTLPEEVAAQNRENVFPILSLLLSSSSSSLRAARIRAAASAGITGMKIASFVPNLPYFNTFRRDLRFRLLCRSGRWESIGFPQVRLDLLQTLTSGERNFLPYVLGPFFPRLSIF